MCSPFFSINHILSTLPSLFFLSSSLPFFLHFMWPNCIKTMVWQWNLHIIKHLPQIISPLFDRTIRTDVSMKVHINLAIALILLNVHFLPSHTVAELSSPGLCLYVALSLHFSLLATFSWMAVEGFHLYLLLIRVFNIYVRRYLLKISLVGWGE